MAMVSVYIREPFAEVLLVDEDTSIMDFISSVGGLLGLCMGFSFVTVGEVCYFCFLGVMWPPFFAYTKEIPKNTKENMPSDHFRFLK